MPIYEYRCADCDTTFEVLQTMKQHAGKHRPRCPHCDGAKTEPRWSRVAVQTTSKGYHPAEPADV